MKDQPASDAAVLARLDTRRESPTILPASGSPPQAQGQPAKPRPQRRTGYRRSKAPGRQPPLGNRLRFPIGVAGHPPQIDLRLRGIGQVELLLAATGLGAGALLPHGLVGEDAGDGGQALHVDAGEVGGVAMPQQPGRDLLPREGRHGRVRARQRVQLGLPRRLIRQIRHCGRLSLFGKTSALPSESVSGASAALSATLRRRASAAIQRVTASRLSPISRATSAFVGRLLSSTPNHRRKTARCVARSRGAQTFFAIRGEFYRASTLLAIPTPYSPPRPLSTRQSPG